MKRSQTYGKSFVLMVLAAILLLGGGRAVQAQLMGQQFDFTVPRPDMLGQYSVTAQPVQPPFDPGDPASNDAFVGMTQSGYMALDYYGTDGQYHRWYRFISIDNTSGAISLVSGGNLYPVATLADIFSTLPSPPLALPAYLLVYTTDPVILTVQAGGGGALAGAVAAPTYITDQGNEVTTFDRGKPADVPNPTLQDALDDIGETLYDKLTKIADPTWSYDCHGYTFANGAVWINNNQVQQILNDNGGLDKKGKPQAYQPVDVGMVQAGDVVIYKLDGAIVHSGVVVLSVRGVPTLVRSKWGALGLYDHAPTAVLASYGTPSYWHTNRQGGNLLKTKGP